MTAKQILLYKSPTNLTQRDMTELNAAGIIAIQVQSFDDVKVIDPYTADTRNEVWLSAMEAIVKANATEGPRTIFGHLLAERLTGCAPAKTEVPQR